MPSEEALDTSSASSASASGGTTQDVVSVNATTLGRDLLFICLWVGAWGMFDITIDWITVHEKYQFLLFAILFLASFVALLFVIEPS